MKLTFFTTLALLISTNALADKERALARYNRFLTSVKVGAVFETKSIGEEYEIVKTGSAYQARKKKVNGLERSIVLKKESDKIYHYVEFTDSVNPEKSYKRVLITKSILEIVPAVLNIPETVIGTRRATILLKNEGYLQKETATLEQTSHLSVDMDVREFCDTKLATTFKDVTFAYSGSRTPMAPVSNLWVMSCGEPLSKEEVNKINLSSIALCTENLETDDPDCDEKGDLSYLLPETL